MAEGGPRDGPSEKVPCLGGGTLGPTSGVRAPGLYFPLFFFFALWRVGS